MWPKRRCCRNDSPLQVERSTQPVRQVDSVRTTPTALNCEASHPRPRQAPPTNDPDHRRPMHLARRSGQKGPSRPPGTPPAAAEASTTPTRRSTCSPRHSAGSPTTRSSSEQAGPSTGTSSSGSTTPLGSTSHVFSVVKAMSAKDSAYLRGLPYWSRRSHDCGWSTRSRGWGGSGMAKPGWRCRVSPAPSDEARHIHIAAITGHDACSGTEAAGHAASGPWPVWPST